MAKNLYTIGLVSFLIVVVLAIIATFNVFTVGTNDKVMAVLPVTLYNRPVGGTKVCDMTSAETGTVTDFKKKTFGSTDQREYYYVSSLSTKCTGWSEVSIFHFIKVFWK
jgi:hypothetical protein